MQAYPEHDEGLRDELTLTLRTQTTHDARSFLPPFDNVAIARWREKAACDAELLIYLSRVTDLHFVIASDDDEMVWHFSDESTTSTSAPTFSIVATTDAWSRFFALIPIPTYQNLFGMLYARRRHKDRW